MENVNFDRVSLEIKGTDTSEMGEKYLTIISLIDMRLRLDKQETDYSQKICWGKKQPLTNL